MSTRAVPPSRSASFLAFQVAAQLGPADRQQGGVAGVGDTGQARAQILQKDGVPHDEDTQGQPPNHFQPASRGVHERVSRAANRGTTASHSGPVQLSFTRCIRLKTTKTSSGKRVNTCAKRRRRASSGGSSRRVRKDWPASTTPTGVSSSRIEPSSEGSAKRRDSCRRPVLWKANDAQWWAKVPDDHRRENRRGQQPATVGAGSAKPSARRRVEPQKKQGRGPEQGNRVFGKHTHSQAGTNAQPCPGAIIEKTTRQEVQRSRPTGRQRRVGRHDPAAHEEERQQLHQQHRRLARLASILQRGEPEREKTRHQRTNQRGAAHPEFIVTEAGDAQVDQPRHHRRMVEVAVVEVLRVVPVVRFLREQVDPRQVGQPQQQQPTGQPQRRVSPPDTRRGVTGIVGGKRDGGHQAQRVFHGSFAWRRDACRLGIVRGQIRSQASPGQAPSHRRGSRTLQIITWLPFPSH